MSEFYTDVVTRFNKILVRGYRNGIPFREKVDYEPFGFLPAKKGSTSPFKTIQGEQVDYKRFDSIRHFKEYRKKYSDIENFQIYGMDKPEYLYIYENYQDMDYQTHLLKVCVLDIEVSMKEGNPIKEIDDAPCSVTAITLYYPNQDQIIVLGFKDFKKTADNISYIKCSSEIELFQKLFRIFNSQSFCPDIITGWNIELFDIPYLVNRIRRLFGDDHVKQLSPWNSFDTKEIEIYGKPHTVYFPVGIAILDYQKVYKKFVGVFEPQESYRLNHIAFVELGEEKLDYSDYGNLDRLYEENHQLFIEYNIRDCTLIKEIDDKRNLLELVCIIAYGAGVNFSDALGTTRSWDVAIHNYLLDKQIVIPKFEKKELHHHPAGGFVKDPLRDKYEWLVSFDLTSMYPHLIIGYNIGPDTMKGKLPRNFSYEQIINGDMEEYQEYLKNNNYTVSANACLFDRSKTSFLSDLMVELFQLRKQYKDKMKELKKEKEKSDNPKAYDSEISKYDTLQYSMKVRLNSAYGALLNKYFRWFDIDMGEAITKSGQLTIKWAEAKINELMNRAVGSDNVDYIVAIDTDSVYVNMGPLVKHKNPSDQLKFVNDFCDNVMEPYLDKIYEDLAQTMNCKEQAMHMKREIIADRGVFIAKKRYMMNMIANEDIWYKEPVIKITGIESVRSNTPSSCRKAIEEAIKIILQKDEDALHKFTEEFYQEYKQKSFDEIAFNTTANNLDKYSDPHKIYGYKCPAYTKAAILYNHHRTKLGLEDKIGEIFEGEKVKWCYLKLPNPIAENVIAVPTESFPKELGLLEYIDYQTQFEKSFEEPLKRILDIIGWTTEPVNTLKGLWE